MEKTIEQLQKLQNIYAQLQTSLQAQEHHLGLIIHILQMQQSQTPSANATNNNKASNTFIEESINNFINSYAGFAQAINNITFLNCLILKKLDTF